MLIALTIASGSGKSSGSATNLLPILLILGVALMWLIVVRPQRRKQKMQQSMQSDLAVGDEILTAGGVYGTVTRIDDDDVRVEIAPNVEIRLARRAIAAQLTEHAPSAATASAEPEDAAGDHWQSAFDAESDAEKPG